MPMQHPNCLVPLLAACRWCIVYMLSIAPIVRGRCKARCALRAGVEFLRFAAIDYWNL